MTVQLFHSDRAKAAHFAPLIFSLTMPMAPHIVTELND